MKNYNIYLIVYLIKIFQTTIIYLIKYIIKAKTFIFEYNGQFMQDL